MAISLSELYGKQIITNGGQKVGIVEDIILDVENKKVANLLLKKFEELTRTQSTPAALAKNSIKYDRVDQISEIIIIKTK
ncbi:MAG: PRC-barrel domain-containing protein [Candidatus Marsarchaeota archaeon]|jgi:sporulation protein YlmC with PRC-barrel domain|nr:PRC-barrel domain-containing protein [Candidatus Marsarchaeota archaeon]